MLALSCAPEGRPDAAAAAVMLAGLLPWRGLAWLGLHVRDGDQLLHALLVAVATISHLSLFFFARNVKQAQPARPPPPAAPAPHVARKGKGKGVLRSNGDEVM